MRILLIDDDKDDQLIFAEAVCQIAEELQCQTADNGYFALQALNSSDHLPDVIFMDINMPKMDGRQTLHALRLHSKLKEIPVVIYSTSNNDKDIRWAKDMDARYLVKPTDFPQLVKELERMINETLLTDYNQRLILHVC